MLNKTETLRIRVEDPEHGGERVLQSDLQRSYAAGMGEGIALGGHQSHVLCTYQIPLTDPETIKHALTELLRRHDIFRTYWDTELQPAFAAKLEMIVPVYSCDDAELTQNVQTIREEMFREEIDVSRAPLVRCAVIRSSERQILLMHESELLCDGFSHEIIRKDLDALLTGNEPEPLQCGYQDYLKTIADMREWGFLDDDRAYWQETVSDSWQAPAFVYRKQPELILTSETEQITRKLDDKTIAQLNKIAEDHDVTLSALLLTVYAKVLERYSKTKDFVMIVPRTARAVPCENINDIVGVCSDFFVYENRKWEQGSLLDEIRLCRDQVNRAISHSFLSGMEILQLHRQKTGKTLPANVSFTSTLSGAADTAAHVAIEAVRMHTSQLVLETCIVPVSGGADICTAFVKDALERYIAEGILDMFAGTVRAIADGTHPLVSTARFALTDRDRAAIDRVNTAETNPPDYTQFRKRFLETIRQRGDRNAIAFAGGTITYRQLLRDIGGIHAFFSENGLHEGDVIGIQLPKQPLQAELAAASVLSGVVYMPLEYELPPDSAAACLKQSGSAAVITDRAYGTAAAEAAGIRTFFADDLLAYIAENGTEEVTAVNDETDKPVIIINTSGTTGTPKSSILLAYSIYDCICQTESRLGVSGADTSIAVTNFAHDMAIFDHLFMLVYGGCTVIPDSQLAKEPSHWISLMKQYHVTVWNSVPAFHEMCTTALQTADLTDFQSLRIIISGGDFLTPRLVHTLWKLHPGVTIFNVGGPSETTVWNISHRIEPQDAASGEIPYGIPFAGTGYLLLDDNMTECPLGSEGNMYICGRSLSAGYAGAEALNRKKFTEYFGKRIYNTGDRGIRRADGELLLTGRSDSQIKLNGKTISLTGIGSALRQFDAIQDAAVDFDADTKRIIAYVVTADADRKQIEAFLRKHIPPYQFPQVYIHVDKIPLTRNAKPDQRALRAVYQESCNAQAAQRPADRTEQIDEITAFLIKTLREIFGREDIGADANYFALGGDSITAVRICAAVQKQYGVELRLFDLLGRPYLSEWKNMIAEKLADAKKTKKTAITVQEICEIISDVTGQPFAAEHADTCLFRLSTDLNMIRKIAEQIAARAAVPWTQYDIAAMPYPDDWCAALERRIADHA